MAEVAKPFTFVFCILSLYGVFYAAFLDPARDLDQRICDSLALLLLAAGISLVSGLIFREAESQVRNSRLASTLPVQMFCWASSLMLLLFVVSHYLESSCVFYRDIRFYAGM
jgi:hypothetical protein